MKLNNRDCYKRLLINLFMLICFFSSISKANTVNSIPFVKGSFAQIKQENQNSPYIVAFWSETCTYCMKELAMFGRLLKQYPDIKLVTISTDPFLEEDTVTGILNDSDLLGTETWVFADNFAERLYYEINPRWRGELPLTYFFDRSNKMLKHMGEVKEAELIEWLTLQTVK